MKYIAFSIGIPMVIQTYIIHILFIYIYIFTHIYICIYIWVKQCIQKNKDPTVRLTVRVILIVLFIVTVVVVVIVMVLVQHQISIIISVVSRRSEVSDQWIGSALLAPACRCSTSDRYVVTELLVGGLNTGDSQQVRQLTYRFLAGCLA